MMQGWPFLLIVAFRGDESSLTAACLSSRAKGPAVVVVQRPPRPRPGHGQARGRGAARGGRRHRRAAQDHIRQPR